MCVRLERLASGALTRDRTAWAEEILPREQAYEQRAVQHRILEIHDPALDHYRWMLEEYRVSLFAQRLGTSLPVSAKRLDQQWAQVRG